MQLADVKDLSELRNFVYKNEWLYSVSGRKKTKFPTKFLNWMTKEDLNGFFAISSYKGINPIEHYILFDENGIDEFEKEHVGIKVASDFTRYISPAHVKIRSGVLLRDEYLIPLIANNPDKKLVVDMDGLDYVYPSVLDDIFNGLIKMMGEDVRKKVEVVCHDQQILEKLKKINW